MMRVLMTLAVCVALAGAQSCDNPMFVQPQLWGMTSAMDLTALKISPMPAPALATSSACSAYSSAFVQTSCCTTDTIAQIDAAFATAKAAIDAAGAAISTGTAADTLVATLKGAIDPACAMIPGADCAGIDAALTQFGVDYASELNAMTADQVKCAEGLLAYAEGMVCFACDVDWAKFVNNQTLVIELATSTCTAVNAACSSLFSGSKTLAALTNNLMTQISAKLGAGAGALPSVTASDMCGGTAASPGDCYTYLCDTMLNGLSVPQYSGMRRRLNSEPTAAELAHESILDLHHRSLTQVFEGMASPVRSLAATTGHNTYSANGYDAYNVGCSSSNTCPAAISAGSSPAAVAAAAVVSGFVAVGVVVAGVFYYRRRNMAHAALPTSA